VKNILVKNLSVTNRDFMGGIRKFEIFQQKQDIADFKTLNFSEF